MSVLIVSLIFALIVAIFALQNAAPVLIQFFWVTAKVPLVLVILASALAGALIVFLLALWREFRYKHKKTSKDNPEAGSKEAKTQAEKLESSSVTLEKNNEQVGEKTQVDD